MSRLAARFYHRKRDSERFEDIELNDLNDRARGRSGSHHSNETHNGEAFESAPSYRAIFAFTRRSHAKLFAIGVAAAVVKGASGPAGALLTGKIFGALSAYRPGITPAGELISKVRLYVLYLLAVGAGTLILQIIFFTSWVLFGERQALEARRSLFQALLGQEMTWYDRRKDGPSAMIPRLNAQIRDLQLAASQPLGAVFSIVSNACFSFGLAMFYSWKLTLVIMASIPVVLVFTVVTNRPVSYRGFMQQQKKTEALKIMSDSINAIDTVKCCNAQSFEQQRYSSKIKEVAYWFWKTIHINAMQQGFVQFMASALFVQAFYYGGVLVRSGEKNPGDIVTTFLSALSVFTSLNSINGQMLVLELGRLAGSRMQKIMADVNNTATEIDKEPGSYIPKTLFNNLKGYIEFDRVTFAYPTRRKENILRDLQMKIPLGQFSFIVGQNGSGKSTISQLLGRLYEPGQGSIKVAKYNIKSFNKQHIRKLIQVVEQHSLLFNETIRSNIFSGYESTIDQRSSSIDDRYRDAVEFGLIHGLLADLPEQDDTVVGRFGAAVSGGQRQRVALARARMRDAPIMILDEATSALDSLNRNALMAGLRRWRTGPGKTTIMITHDMELINDDDYVFVMDRGQLVREGRKGDMPDLQDHVYRRKASSHSFSPVVADETSRVASPMTPSSPRPRAPSIPTSPDHIRRHVLETNQSGANKYGRDENDQDPIDIYMRAAGERRLSKRLSTLTMLAPQQTRFSVHNYNYPWIQPAASLDPSEQYRAPQLFPTTELKHEYDLTLQPYNSRVQELGQIQQAPANRYSQRLEDIVREAASQCGETFPGVSIRRQGMMDHDDAWWRRRTSRMLHRGIDSYVQEIGLEKPPTMTFKQILKTVWPVLTRKQRIAILACVPLCAVHAAASPVTSLLTNKLIGTYSFGPQSTRTAAIYAGCIFAVALVDGFTQYLQQVSFESLSQTWINKMREQAAEKLLQQPKQFFCEDENAPGTLVETLDRHADDARNVLGRFVPLYTIIAVLIAVSTIWSFVTEYRLTFVTLSFFPLIFGLSRAFGSVSRKWEGLCNDAAERVNLVFIETFTCIKTIKLLTAEPHFLELAKDAYHAAYKVGKKRAIWSGLFYGLSEASATVAQVAIFYYGAVLATQGAAVAQITLVLLMLIMTFAQATMILGVIPQTSISRDAATRLLNLVNLPLTTHEREGSIRPSRVGHIEFRKVNFGYPSRPFPPALRNVSFTIPHGTYVAIVGGSGSGKSTIASLLVRLWDLPKARPTDEAYGDPRANQNDSLTYPDGQILLSSRNMTSYHVATLRERLAFVQQSPTLLAGTIRDNMGYGLEHVPDHAIAKAAADAGAEFVAFLPKGFSTQVGEGGSDLSGGQRQTVGIARALARLPDVLVLDEPTSALDERTARTVTGTLWGLVREWGRTVVVITHDQRLMKGADKIVWMQGGRVRAQASYDSIVRGPLAREFEEMVGRPR